MPDPGVFDTSRPHSARMYDYFLGGKDNYDADQHAARKVAEVFPSIVIAARANRHFMHRATDYLARTGVRQFLDIGTGIPTTPNLHQIAQQIDPTSRVVYVDNDPLVLAHARALLFGTREGATAYIAADARDPARILDAPELAATLDLSQPVAVSLYALLHFIGDDHNPYGVVETLLERLCSGSYLALSHATGDFAPEQTAAAAAIYRAQGIEVRTRTEKEFAGFLDGLEIVEPGIVPPHRWNPHIPDLATPSAHVLPGVDPAAAEDAAPIYSDAQVSFYAALARKP